MRAANSWLGSGGQCAAIAGGRGVFCEKGLRGPVAADPQGDSYVQQLACEEDRPFSRYLLNRAGRDLLRLMSKSPRGHYGCPLRAKSPVLTVGQPLPVYDANRTSAVPAAIPQKCQRRKCRLL